MHASGAEAALADDTPKRLFSSGDSPDLYPEITLIDNPAEIEQFLKGQGEARRHQIDTMDEEVRSLHREIKGYILNCEISEQLRQRLEAKSDEPFTDLYHPLNFLAGSTQETTALFTEVKALCEKGQLLSELFMKLLAVIRVRNILVMEEHASLD